MEIQPNYENVAICFHVESLGFISVKWFTMKLVGLIHSVNRGINPPSKTPPPLSCQVLR